MASQGGNFAVLAAASTQVPLGVPANLPVTLAEAIRPPLDTEMLMFAMPGTLYWLKHSFTLGCTAFIALTMSLWERAGSAAAAGLLGLGSSPPPPPLVVPTWLSKSSIEPPFLAAGLVGAGGVTATSGVGFFPVSTAALAEGAASIEALATGLPPFTNVFFLSATLLSSPGFSSDAAGLAGSAGAGAPGLGAAATPGAGGASAGTTICGGTDGGRGGTETTR